MPAAAVSKPDLDLPARPRILVITLRRLGDVLLTTPLIRSIRRGFNQATLDVLVFRGSDAVLHGNAAHLLGHLPRARSIVGIGQDVCVNVDHVVIVNRDESSSCWHQGRYCSCVR